jgi:multiple sugar transport system permease protein
MAEVGRPQGIARPRPTLRRILAPRRAEDASPGLRALSYLVIVLGCVIAVGPFFYLLSTSLKSSTVLFRYPPEWIPEDFYWGNYGHLINDTQFLRWVANTLIVAFAVTALKLLFDSMAGYAFAKMQFPLKNVLFVLIIATLMIPFSAILIPLYFLVRDFGLLNTYWALILPALANPIGIFLMRSFIESLPGDLENAARLDGASEFRIYWTVILPLVKPGLVVLAVLTFLVQYTAFLWPLVAATGDDMKLLTTGLATQRGVQVIDYGVFSAGALMALIPITIFFVLLQRYFIAGSLAGALKQ